MDGLPTWPIYMKWSAIACIGAAVERRVWTQLIDHAGPIYPNLFLGLIGPPGNGKTTAINECEKFWRKTDVLRVAPDKMTQAALLDDLKDAGKTVPIPGKGYITYHSLQIPAEEMSALIPANDLAFLGMMNKLYDCRYISERLRTRKEQVLTIPNVQSTLICGGQPDYLTAAMPPEAWGQGFMSRFLFVWGDAREPTSMFEHKEDTHRFLRMQCEDDIKQLTQISGHMRWSPEAEAAGDAWVKGGRKPVPTHPKLKHYCSRRQIHIAKLAMISSLARGNSLIITLDDWNRAMSWLLEAEAEATKIFRAMATGGDGPLLYDAWLYCWDRFKDHKEATHERYLIQFIAQRAVAQNVTAVLKNLQTAGMIKMAPGDQRPGFIHYLPVPQDQWDPENEVHDNDE